MAGGSCHTHIPDTGAGELSDAAPASKEDYLEPCLRSNPFLSYGHN